VSLLPPESVRREYTGRTWSVAWEWPGLATTWRVESAAEDATAEARTLFVKVVRAGHYPTLLDEAERMSWARDHLPVPAVVGHGSDGTVDWMTTVGLDGIDASQHPFLHDPERIVPILARGLAEFHRRAPAASCPFDFRVDAAIDHARRRVHDGVVKPADLHPEHAHLTPADALAELTRHAPASEDLVVCHGDYCVPNVLLDETGTVTGYVDLGELGLADRWWDVAVGAWSTTWNVGNGWEELFYASYGIAPDADRIRFYRLLYDLVS
jgi:kanamycin kinase